MENEKSDNSIIMFLVNDIKKNNKSWYITREDDEVINYKTTVKVTNNKFISYNILYKKNNPEKTFMTIFFETKIFSNGKFLSTKSNKIRTITGIRLIYILREIFIKEGKRVNGFVYSIIENKEKPNEILMIVKKDNLFSLPGGKFLEVEKTPEMALSRILSEEIGFFDIKTEQLKYKDIIKINDKDYMYVHLLRVTDYNYKNIDLSDLEIKDIYNRSAAKWINKDDLFNIYLDKNAEKILSFYVNNF